MGGVPREGAAGTVHALSLQPLHACKARLHPCTCPLHAHVHTQVHGDMHTHVHTAGWWGNCPYTRVTLATMFSPCNQYFSKIIFLKLPCLPETTDFLVYKRQPCRVDGGGLSTKPHLATALTTHQTTDLTTALTTHPTTDLTTHPATALTTHLTTDLTMHLTTHVHEAAPYQLNTLLATHTARRSPAPCRP